MKDKISQSYKLSRNIYDDVLTHRKWWSKLYIKLFWNNVDDNEIAYKLLSRIPENISGKLLDVPTGTAVFTYRKYKELENAEITCLDYSMEMLAWAKMRFEENSNVEIVQGDVGALSFESESFDIVLSMNGVHAFPDKEKAYREIHRVLKSGGKLLASFYVQNESRISDALVKFVLAKKGWFSPPFETASSVYKKLMENYFIEDYCVQGAFVYFLATKK